jgi:hypothetical protein
MYGVGAGSVTRADEDYSSVLPTEIATGAIAAFCLAMLLVRGPWPWRLAAGVSALPMVFLVEDIMRRTPQFGW